MRTVLIADDLTGALDAGVCLLPADVTVAVSPTAAGRLLSTSTTILSINAGTRHLRPEDAASRVHELVTSVRRAGVSVVVKKTDSALRGNVGAELAAAWRASGVARLHFLPALPSMGRTTSQGVQLVDGVPVDESAFGRDPFEPVTCSRIDELITSQALVPVRMVAEGEPVPTAFEGIVVYDATTCEEMLRRVQEIVSMGESGMMAGCAGLATALAEVLGLRDLPVRAPEGRSNLLVVCGSVNPVSAAQCAYAAEKGAPVMRIGAAEKCDSTWMASHDGEAFVADVVESWRDNPLTVVDGSALENLAGVVAPGLDVRQVVADNIGSMVASFCKRDVCGRLLVMGGDILSSFLGQVGADTVRPLGEVAPGIVGFGLEVGGRPLVAAAKSGGFGNRELFVKMAGPHEVKEKIQ